MLGRIARVLVAVALAAGAIAVYASVAAGDSGPGHDGDDHGDRHDNSDRHDKGDRRDDKGDRDDDKGDHRHGAKDRDRDEGEHHRRHHFRHRDKLIRVSLAPSETTDPTFHGVAPGGAPWVLDRGEVRLRLRHHRSGDEGRLELRVRGLVIPDPPGDDTPGPVETISASLYCGADADTAAVDTTDQVPIDDDGDARIRDDDFTVPDTCLGPVVLVHPNGIAAAYIAVSGWRL
ncbi:MAG TPA: hypothetical protein VGF25_18395 [Thermoleophilaceae bacterium]|jgi:hypothetical protein